MVDEGAIREALLIAQEKLIIAYRAGPAALDTYFLDFEALKKQIIDASRLGLLSPETMRLAANVVGGIPAIAQSFMALEQEAARALAKIDRDTRDRPIVCQDDEQEHADGETSRDLYEDDDTSSEGEAGETDLDDQSEDLDTEDQGLRLDTDVESDDEDEDDHPNAPQWNLLRDWLLNNISHPFVYDEIEHTEMLRGSNVSYRTFVDWLSQMRESMQWDELVQNYANGDPRKWRRILMLSRDNASDLSPEVLAAIAQMKTIIDENYDQTIPLWWEESITLVERMEEAFWIGATEHLHWSSDEPPESNEQSYGEDAHEDIEVLSQNVVEPRDTTSPARLSLVGTKRKALEMSTYELPRWQESSRSYGSYDDEQPAAKRKKPDNSEISPPVSCRNSLPIISGASSSGSGSPRATPYSPAPESVSSSRTPASPSVPSVKRDPADLTITASQPALPKVARRSSVSPPFLDADLSANATTKTQSPPVKSNPQAQIPTGMEPVPPYVRSQTIHFDRKRKRKVGAEDYVISQPGLDMASIPTAQIAASVSMRDTRVNFKPTPPICSFPNQPSIAKKTFDQPPPFKRLRPNDSISSGLAVLTTPSPSDNPLSSNKYKSDWQAQQESPLSLTSHPQPPATDFNRSVATSPCEAQSEGRKDIELSRILEEINTADHETASLGISAVQLDSPDFSKWGTSTGSYTDNEDSDYSHHLLDPYTPSLSVTSPRGESPYSCAEAITSTPATDFAPSLLTPCDVYCDNSAVSRHSGQVFGDLAPHRRTLEVKKDGPASE